MTSSTAQKKRHATESLSRDPALSLVTRGTLDESFDFSEA